MESNSHKLAVLVAAALLLIELANAGQQITELTEMSCQKLSLHNTTYTRCFRLGHEARNNNSGIHCYAALSFLHPGSSALEGLIVTEKGDAYPRTQVSLTVGVGYEYVRFTLLCQSLFLCTHLFCPNGKCSPFLCLFPMLDKCYPSSQ